MVRDTKSQPSGSSSQLPRLPVDAPDYRVLFEKTPGLYLVLDMRFTIVAANLAFCQATMTQPDEIIGRALFEVFPDNPDDSGAVGVATLRNSLLHVIKTRQRSSIDEIKYDIRRPSEEGGTYEERYWRCSNVPILGDNSYVRWIIHAVEDVTELVTLRRLEADGHRRAALQDKQMDDLRRSNGLLTEKVAQLKSAGGKK